MGLLIARGAGKGPAKPPAGAGKVAPCQAKASPGQMGFGPRGIEPEGAAQKRSGAVEEASVASQQGQVKPSGNKVGAQTNRMAKGALGMEHAALLAQQTAEVNPRRREGRPERDGAPDSGFGFESALQPVQRECGGEVRFRHSRAQGQHIFKQRKCLVETAGAAQRVAQSEQRRHQAWVEAKGDAIARNRFLDAAGSKLELSQSEQRQGIGGIQPQGRLIGILCRVKMAAGPQSLAKRHMGGRQVGCGGGGGLRQAYSSLRLTSGQRHQGEPDQRARVAGIADKVALELASQHGQSGGGGLQQRRDVR